MWRTWGRRCSGWGAYGAPAARGLGGCAEPAGALTGGTGGQVGRRIAQLLRGRGSSFRPPCPHVISCCHLLPPAFSPCFHLQARPGGAAAHGRIHGLLHRLPGLPRLRQERLPAVSGRGVAAGGWDEQDRWWWLGGGHAGPASDGARRRLHRHNSPGTPTLACVHCACLPPLSSPLPAARWWRRCTRTCRPRPRVRLFTVKMLGAAVAGSPAALLRGAAPAGLWRRLCSQVPQGALPCPICFSCPHCRAPALPHLGLRRGGGHAV